MRQLLLLPALLALTPVAVSAEQFDTLFHGTGRVELSLSFSSVYALALLERPGGGMVVATAQSGLGCAGPECPAVTFYSSGGTYQSGIGLTATSFSAIFAATMDSSGRVIMVGATPGMSNSNFQIVRLLPSGFLDTDFGSGGIATVDFFGQEDVAYAVTVDKRDNVVVAGTAQTSKSAGNFAIARLRVSDGSLDSNFGLSGKVTIPFSLSAGYAVDRARALAIDGAGRILIAGTSPDPAINADRVSLARLNSDGSADSSFCSPNCNFQGAYTAYHNGRRVYYFGNNTVHADEVFGIDVRSDGGFYIVGDTYSGTFGTQKSSAIARFDVGGNYVTEALGTAPGFHGRFNGVRVADASGTRVIASGANSTTVDDFEFGFTIQAFDANLTPLTGYGNCPTNTSAFCFAGNSATGNRTTSSGALNLDRLGRPLFAGSYRDNEIDDPVVGLVARITNATGPRPDVIFRAGFH
ncbi:MAG: delta-60 repeat domain-containing protein [Tahibacter sp.]